AALVDGHVDPDVAREDEVERADGLDRAREADARVETGAAHGELELQERGLDHADALQKRHPTGSISFTTAVPCTTTKSVRRLFVGAVRTRRSASLAASAPSIVRAAGAASGRSRSASSRGNVSGKQARHERQRSVATTRRGPSMPSTTGIAGSFLHSMPET